MWVFRYHALSNRGFDLHKLTAILLVLIALLIPVGARAVRPQSDAGTHSARKIEITDRDLRNLTAGTKVMLGLVVLAGILWTTLAANPGR